MVRLFSGLSCGFLLLFSFNVLAETSSDVALSQDYYFYAGLRGGRALLDSDEIDARLDDVTGHRHDGYYHYHDAENDDVAFFSVFAGKKFIYPLRLELEYTYNNELDFVNRNNINADIKSRRLMLNLYYDRQIGKNVFLNLGLGLGVSDNEISGSGLVDKSSEQFTFSLGVGVVFEIKPRIHLETGYRYVKLGDIDFIDTASANKSDDLESQESYLGVRFLF